MQEPIYIYAADGTLAETVTQVIDSQLNDRLDGTLTLSFTSKVGRLPDITADTLIEFKGQYYRATRAQSSVSGHAFLMSVSCEQESISLVDMEIEEFNFTGTADDALARLLDGTGITATAEHTGTITVSASGGNRRAVLLEIAKLCEGEIEYSGHTIRIRNRRGNTEPIDIAEICRCYDVVKSDDPRNGTESYELAGLNPDGYGVGDEVQLDFAPLGISVQKRIVGISYNPFDCRSVSVEIGDYVTDITDDYASLDKIFLMKADAKIEIEKYINSAEGTAAITAALEGTYVTADALTGYVQTSELDTSIKQYLDGEEGIASITSAVSGKFMAAPPTYTYTKPSSVTYGFELTDDGYYTSTNAGVNSTFSYGIFTFKNPSAAAQKITLRCISYGQSNYDYGIVSTINKSLAMSTTADSSNVLKSFKGASSATPVDLELTIPTGTSTVSFKYRKSAATHADGDYFKIIPLVGEFVTEAEMSSRITQEVTALGASLTLSVVNDEKSSVIKLNKDGVALSSQTIQFTGEVVFKTDLANAGSTTINGANITTGKISAERIDTSTLYTKKVLLNTDDDDYPMISSELSGESAYVKVGMTEDNGWTQFVDIHGTYVRFARPGYETDDDSNGFKIHLPVQKVVPNSGDEWWFGTNKERLGYVWARRHGFFDNTYLLVTDGELRFCYPVGRNANDAVGYEYDYEVLATYDENY